MRRSIKHQQGVILIVALVFLLILTVAGVSAMRLSVVEERMSGSFSDRNLAFQAAEAALVDAESWLRAKNFQTTNFYYECSGEYCFKSTCDKGLCFAGNDVNATATNDKYRYKTGGECLLKPVSTPANEVYQNPAIWNDESKHQRASVDMDGSGPMAQAKFIVEFLCYTVKTPDSVPEDQFDNSNKYSAVYWEPLYRITAIGFGRKPSTRVMLQTTFRRD